MMFDPFKVMSPPVQFCTVWPAETEDGHVVNVLRLGHDGCR
ncbi:MAG TPA: hypothetical protein PKD61_13635 [Polyangiaceae bacterium]|nr:hypothetical protein [Polyangiaceae bacterium]